jgi:uncharacterized protein (TIGR02266 family)
LADPNTRSGKRTPVTLKIKFKSETLEQFIERYAVDVSQGGIFIRTKEPLAVGTQMRFEFQLRDASPLIGGEGTVVWTRENDPSRPAIAPGMGVRFDRLAEGSQGVLERILTEKAKQTPNRPASDSIKPPLFTDTPTRVAPVPLQEQLLADYARQQQEQKQKRRAEEFNDNATPLPKPMPFATDADEFPEEAFEEATKVRALDELVAQTADPSEAAAALLADAEPDVAPSAGRAPFADAESVPALPIPPETATSKSGRLQVPTPPPRTEAPPPSPPSPPSESHGAKTKLGIGLEAPRMQTPSAVPLPGSGAGPGSGPVVGGPMIHATAGGMGSGPARAVSSESTGPVRKPMPTKGGSSVPVAILVLVLVAAAAGGVWFFALRDKTTELKPAPTTGSDVGTGSGSAPAGTGSAPAGSGSQIAGTGSGTVDDDSDKIEMPKGPTVDTVIESNVPKSRVEVVGADQSGDAPFTAKLEKDKSYKVRVWAPGYTALQFDLVGGAPKHAAALVPKPRVLSIKTDPPGALISIDGVTSSKLTPYDLELTKAQAAKKFVRVRLFKTGYKLIEKVVDTDKYTEDDARMVATVDEKMQGQTVNRPPDRGSGAGSDTRTGSAGSAAVTPPGGGSATPPPPPPPPPGDGSAAPPAGGGSQGAAP